MAPLWETPLAVAEILGLAHAGTAIFCLFVLLASLEFLRSSSGRVLALARVLSVLAFLLAGASLVYGDFLRLPARAAVAALLAQLPERRPDTAFLATFGAATAGIAFQAGRFNAQAARGRNAGRAARRHVSAPGGTGNQRALALAITERLHLRQLTHNPRKPVTRQPKSQRMAVPVRNWG